MKKIVSFSLFIAAILLFSQGCSDSDDNTFLNVSETELIFTDVSAQSITIETNDNWVIQSVTPSGVSLWFTVLPERGAAGEHLLSIRPLGANLGMTERTGNLLITAGGITRSVELRQTIEADILLSSTTINVPPEGGMSVPVTLTINDSWTFEWLKEETFLLDFSAQPSIIGSPGVYALTFSANEANETGSIRTAEFIIRSGEGQRATITISQEAVVIENSFYSERDVVTLQRATVGNGVNLLLLGDGFTQQDMARGGNGRYEQVMRQAMEYFFDVEPYRSYRPYFNVYMMVAVSPQAGVGDTPGEINNRFGSYFAEGTLIEFNFDLCKTFALGAFQETNVQEADITVGLILNSTRYAGTSTMQSNGFSITRCPMSNRSAPNDFRGIIHHELGGHGFARAADEYVYPEQIMIPANEVTEIRMWQQNFDAFGNVDFTNNLSAILWADFIGRPQYTNVGAFQGGLTYNEGVWRPEFNSCMNNNIPYYNGPTRWMAVERITRIAGTPFTFGQFVANDVIDQNAQAIAKSRAGERMAPPLHPPVLMK